jgi:hypothetical protein
LGESVAYPRAVARFDIGCGKRVAERGKSRKERAISWVQYAPGTRYTIDFKAIFHHGVEKPRETARSPSSILDNIM